MENQISQFKNSVKGSITLKLLTIGAVMLVLLYPKSRIEDLIWERQNLRQEAITEVSAKWGLDQIIVGPIVSIPFWEYNEIDEKLYKTKKYAYFLPEKLNIQGDLAPESRYRGIHEVVVYQSNINLNGIFNYPDFNLLNIDPELVIWEEAQLQFSLSDLRGIKESIAVEWDEASAMFKPGLSAKDVLSRGLNVPVQFQVAKPSNFDFSININGSSNISFTPVGAETKVDLQSTWKDPSFTGDLLPVTREIDESGFSASWSVLNLNRSYPQQWVGNDYSLYDSDFGVNLFIPANEYQKSTRSAKYAVLILFLTFITYFFGEILGKKKIHPIQYGIVGLALIIFYTLLVSISEYLPFNMAYGIAAFFIILSVAGYSVSMFQSKKRGIYMGGFLSIVYLFIFIILQSQDYSLLIGSIGLFITLVLVMYFSRNVNWYELKAPLKNPTSSNH